MKEKKWNYLAKETKSMPSKTQLGVNLNPTHIANLKTNPSKAWQLNHLDWIYDLFPSLNDIECKEKP